MWPNTVLMKTQIDSTPDEPFSHGSRCQVHHCVLAGQPGAWLYWGQGYDLYCELYSWQSCGPDGEHGQQRQQRQHTIFIPFINIPYFTLTVYDGHCQIWYWLTTLKWDGFDQ